MKNKTLWVLMLAGVCSVPAMAQYGYYVDALRYSQTDWLQGSSARMQGIGGTQISLGGDVSSIVSNPAGLGFFTKNTAAFTTSLGFVNSDDEYYGTTTANFKNQFVINNAGFVFHYGKGKFTEDKFKGGSLGISWNRVNNFNRQYRYEGVSGSSITDFFVNQANGTGSLNPNNLPAFAFAAYDQFLIDLVDFSTPVDYIEYEDGGVWYIAPNLGDGVDGYSSPFGAFANSIPYQQELVNERGNQYQFNISWGGNYDDRIYFGGGLGLQSLYYRRDRDFLESEFLIDNSFDSPDPWINSIRFKDHLVARGFGINTTFGVIVRPVEVFTVGLSYTTPTFISITEESDFSLEANWNNYVYRDENNLNNEPEVPEYNLSQIGRYLSPIYETEYNLRTPGRLNLGATFFLGKMGFISADVERIDYSRMLLRANDFSMTADNDAIRDNFQAVMNYRLGAEIRMDDLRFRGGYALYPDPTGNDQNRDFITLGVGYRTQDFFLDLAVINSNSTVLYSPYSIGANSPMVNSEIRSTRVAVTAGFNF
jgi:hypothetical protein